MHKNTLLANNHFKINARIQEFETIKAVSQILNNDLIDPIMYLTSGKVDKVSYIWVYAGI